MRPVDRLWIGRKLILAAGDAIAFYAVVALVLSLRGPDGLERSLLPVHLPVLAFTIVAAYASGLYELRLVRDFVSLVGGLLGSGVATWLLGTTYFYLAGTYLRVAPKATLLLIVLGSHLVMLGWRRLVLFATGFSVVDLKILVLTDEDRRDYLRQSFGRGSSEEFRLVHEGASDVDLVVVDQRWAGRHPGEARRLLSSAVKKQMPIVSIDEFYESASGKVSAQHANDLAWALDHLLPRIGSPYFKAKRVFDVTVAAVSLVLLAPLMALIAALIRIVDGISPFYAQMRVGYHGRKFMLWKFRTMRQDAEREGPFIVYSGGRDLRVTRMGGFLRRVRLDELPQLWNVFRGQMSLVGPRPEWIKEVEILEKLVPTYSLRYLVPPGLTGWAQVYFVATNNAQDSVEKHNYDLYYLKHFSLALDFSILLKTIKRVFIKDARQTVASPPVPDQPISDPDVRLEVGSIVSRS